jgi:hypothetical protein
MDLTNPQTAAARLKKISPLRPTLAIVLGSGELSHDEVLNSAKKAGFLAAKLLENFAGLYGNQ